MSVPEQYANDAITTLASSIGSGDTTLTVASTPGFPTIGNFRIRIDNEILLVTGVSGSTFTVTRAVEPVAGVTAAASHSAGATVQQILTVASLALLPAGGTGGVVQTAATFTSPIIGHNVTVTVTATGGLVPNQTVVIESADGTTLVMYGTVSSIVSATQFVFSIGFYGAGTPGTTVAIGTLVAPTGVPEIVQNLYTVVRATGIGAILFSWDSNILKQDAVGNFLYDIDGTAFPSGTGGGLGTPNTLYIGGYHANSSGGTLALWDLGASAWQPITVSAGVFSFGQTNLNSVATQTVTGSKGGNVALGNLLTALANLGLIINSTT